MSKEVMDAGEVAEYLGIAQSTVYKWVELRKIPFTKIGNLLRFPRWLIDQWLTKRATLDDEELYEEFARLTQRYHLEKCLQARGLTAPSLTNDQIKDEIAKAVVELGIPRPEED